MVDIPTNIKSKKLVEKRREQIVTAAIRLFSKKGFHKTTLRDLAEEAGISHGNIYDYIGSKEDILFLIHEQQTAKMFRDAEESGEESSDPVERLRKMIISDINLSYVDREACLLFYQETKAMQKERLRQLSAVERSRLARTEVVIEECIRKRKCRNVNTRLVSNLCKLMSDVWPLKSWDLTGHTTRHQIEQMVLDAIFNGLLQVNSTSVGQSLNEGLLDGAIIMVLFPGNLLGEALFSFLLSAGARVVAYQKRSQSGERLGINFFQQEFPGKLQIFHQDDFGPLQGDLFRQIADSGASLDGVVINWDFIRNGGLPAASSHTDIDDEFRVIQQIIPEMKSRLGNQKPGKIVNIAPSLWRRENDRILFESTKARIMALTEYLADAFGPENTTANCIAPGFIDGLQALIRGEEESTGLEADIPLKRMGKMDDFLKTIGFLLSDSSDYLTGQVLQVSGGLK